MHALSPSASAASAPRDDEAAQAELPPAVWRAVDRNFADALDELRGAPPFADLAVGAWAVLVQLIVGWARDDVAASQHELAVRAGSSVRTLRRITEELVQVGILGAGREGSGVVYRVGPRLELSLREFAWGRDDAIWTRRARPTIAHDSPPPARLADSPPARLADSPPARLADSPPLLIKKKILKTLPSLPDHERPPATAAAPATLAAPTPPLDPATRRAVACRALAARFRRGYPDDPLPARFEERDIAKVVAVTEHDTRTEAELDQLHEDALAGAWPRSRQQPPSVSFVWGHREYFLRNARDGRLKREGPKPAASPRPNGPKPPEEPAVDLPTTATLAEILLRALGPVRPQ